MLRKPRRTLQECRDRRAKMRLELGLGPDDPLPNKPLNGACDRPEFQCQHIIRRLKRRCRRYALRGGRFCQKHNKGVGKLKNVVRNNHLPIFYRKNMTKTLAQAVEEQLAVSPQEQLNLYEELALMRDACGQAVGLYSKARELADAEPDNMKAQNMVLESSLLMRDYLKEVVSICESAHRIEASAKDKVSVHQLHFFVAQLVQQIYKGVGEDITTARHIEHLIRTNLALPAAQGSTGTTISPDMDVRAMDETIPGEDVIDERPDASVAARTEDAL